MLAGLVDHLWQSTCMCSCIGLLAFIARNNFAALRLWLWRLAALKFLVPFALLFSIGGWLGFPVMYSVDPAPASLIKAFAVLAPIASPARVYGWTGLTLLLAVSVALPAAGACACWLRSRLRVERQRVHDEAVRHERDVNDVTPRPGFFNSALLTACALCAISVPLLAGALDDHQRRRARLIANSVALHDARVNLAQAAPGMGTRHRIHADANGVFIRNVNFQDLVAIAYGVGHYAVVLDQMYSSSDPEATSWLVWPRYDIRVVAPVPEPEDFDAYALRQSVTKLLADRFGLEIYQNGKCQPPCGRYAVPIAGPTL